MFVVMFVVSICVYMYMFPGGRTGWSVTRYNDRYNVTDTINHQKYLMSAV